MLIALLWNQASDLFSILLQWKCRKESEHSPEKSNHILLRIPRPQDQQVFGPWFRLFGLYFEESKSNLAKHLVA